MEECSEHSPSDESGLIMQPIKEKSASTGTHVYIYYIINVYIHYIVLVVDIRIYIYMYTVVSPAYQKSIDACTILFAAAISVTHTIRDL